MAKRGRPRNIVTPDDFVDLGRFLKSLSFLLKSQAAYIEIDKARQFNENDLDLVKLNFRLMLAHRKRVALYELIQHKSSTSVPLSSLESEILAYDLTDRDGFFSCHRALNTYHKLEKITKSEIERKQSEQWQEKIKKGKENQSDAQKKRIAENKRKYFLGGVLLKYVAFLKDNALCAADVSEEEALKALVENTVVAQFLSDVTDADENRASNVRNKIKSKHVDLLSALNVVAQEVDQDKRKG